MLFAAMAKKKHSACFYHRKKVVSHDNDALIILGLFQEILLSSSFLDCARKKPGYFTQSRKIHLPELLLFLIFRHCDTLNEEIVSFFSEINQVRCSRQAMFKAMAKINPEAFRVFIWQFSARFYTNKQITVRSMDGYILLAIDGTHIDLPYTEELVKEFGGTLNKFIKKREDIKKPQARVSMLYDVLNHVLLDAWIQSFDVSEMTMLFEHLEKAQRVLRGRKVIILADRYYGSAELYLYCKSHGYAYLIRGKKGHYTDEVSTVQEDGKIELILDEAWIKRMHRPELQDYARSIGTLELRTVKAIYTYKDPGTNKSVIVNGLYFVSTYLAHLSRQQIISLYHSKRWRIEIGYLHLKDHLEAENFNSRKSDNIKCAIYAKLLCLNLLNPFYFEADRIIQENLCHEKCRVNQSNTPVVKNDTTQSSPQAADPGLEENSNPQSTDRATSSVGEFNIQLNLDVVSQVETEQLEKDEEMLNPSVEVDGADGQDHNLENSVINQEEGVNSTETNVANTDNVSDEDASSAEHSSGDDVKKTPYERKPNVRNILYSIRINPQLITYLLRQYDSIYPDTPFEEALDVFCRELSLERISVRPNRHVKRWGRFVKSLPHLKFRVDGRRNPFIERCRNGASGYVTRQ